MEKETRTASVSLWAVVAVAVAASVNGCTCGSKVPKSARERLDQFEAALRALPPKKDSPRLDGPRKTLDRIGEKLPSGVQATKTECHGRFCFRELTYPDRASAQEHFSRPGSPLAAFYQSRAGRFVVKVGTASSDGPYTLLLGQEVGSGQNVIAEEAFVRGDEDDGQSDDCTWQKMANKTEVRRSSELSGSACTGHLTFAPPASVQTDASAQQFESPLAESIFSTPFPLGFPFPPAADAGVQAPSPSVMVCPVQFTVEQRSDTFDKLDRVCVAAHFINNARLAPNTRQCRMRWLASQVYDDGTMTYISMERFTAARTVGGGNPNLVVMGPIAEPVSTLGLDGYFLAFESHQPTYIQALDLVCMGMDPQDQVLRYRFDFDFTTNTAFSDPS